MNLRERMDDMRANWPRLVDGEPEEHIGWLTERYQEILADWGAGPSVTADQCREFARADTAPTDEQLMPLALHAELLHRLESNT